MSDSPESVVRKFFAAWSDPWRTNWAGFSMTPPCGSMVRKECAGGADAIKSELATQLKAVGGVRVEVKSLVSQGTTVMVEQISNASIRRNPVSTIVMAVFELDPEGRIKQWREAYDLNSVMDQIEAAAV
jgi:limonene-1,2-epoxide hydrolase